MATFKVGQRVRKVAHSGVAGATNHAPLGSVGTIVGAARRFGYDWLVDYDDVSPLTDPHFYASSFQLAPLTDPGAQRFIESIKRLKPYEEPTIQNGEILTLPAELVRKLRVP